MNVFLVFFFLQVVLESFPISSSSHLRIVEIFFPIKFLGEAFKVFDRLTNGSTVIILLFLFYKEWSPIVFRVLSFQFYRSSYKRLCRIFFNVIWFVFCSNIVTGLFYALFTIVLKNAAWRTSTFVMWCGLCITAGLLFSLKLLKNNSGYRILTLRISLLLGVVQGLALLPGISRFGSTYVAARWLRLSPRRAIQFSFLIHFPLLVASFLFEGLRKLPKTYIDENIRLISVFYSPTMWLVAILATILGYFGLRWMQRWALDKKLWRVGFYMVVPVVVVPILIWLQQFFL